MILGVIGGLGPSATAYYIELVIKMTDAGCDQEHLEMIVYNSPKIPDRTAYILGKSEENPEQEMILIGKKLAEQGAGCIAIPCITAHYFHKELSENIPVPIIHAIQETGLEIQKSNIQKAGLMATDGTISSGIFQKHLEDMGIEVILPEQSFQQCVMNIIYRDIKAGNPPDMEEFRKVTRHLREQGAQVIILGCTELSLVKKDYDIGPGFVDTMEVLAQRAVLICHGKLKREYETLIEFEKQEEV